MTAPLAITIALCAILALLIVAPSRAGIWRKAGHLIIRAAMWLDTECQARADGQDAQQAAYRQRKGRVA